MAMLMLTFKIFIGLAGNDSDPGTTSDKPFATLLRAKDVFRVVKKNCVLKAPATVYLLGGVYEQTEPFLLTEADSGTNKNPISYSPYQNKKPVISGGKKITGKW